MSLNASWDKSQLNSGCDHNLTSLSLVIDKTYTYFYMLLFLPGLLLNTIALWVLCRHIRKKTKSVIFMINLSVADLAHVLSLPFRIYYYYTKSWPFGHVFCLFCFYLKYLNMYAAIVFWVCISVQRCVFMLKPFIARWWRQRYDVWISVFMWLLVGVALSPYIFMRSSGVSSQKFLNKSIFLDANATRDITSYVWVFSAAPDTYSCFKDLPTRQVSLSLAVAFIVFAELFGFIIPLVCISSSSFCIFRSLNRVQEDRFSSSAHSCLQSVTALNNQKSLRQSHEKRRALRMVLSCFLLFLLCFAPYHIILPLFMMVSHNIISHCAMSPAVLQFHSVSLCLASLNCCLNPLLFYFPTAEFRLYLSVRFSSLSSSSSNTYHCRRRMQMLSAERSF